MEKIFSLVIIVFAASGYALVSQDDDSTACRAFIDCLKDVEQVHDQQCGSAEGSSNNEPIESTSEDCSTIQLKSAHLQQLQSELRQVQLHCVTRSLGNARPVGDEKTHEECKTAISNFRSGTGSVVEISDDIDLDTNTRSKRENFRLIKGIFDNNNNSSSSSSREDSRDNALTTSTTVSPNTEEASSDATVLQSQVSSGAIEREATPVPIATITQLRECHKSVEAKQKLCKPLAACCSEAILCDLKYHLSSPLHNKLYQAKISLYEARQRCMTSRRRKQQPSAPAADVDKVTTATTTTTSTITTSMITTSIANLMTTTSQPLLLINASLADIKPHHERRGH